MKRVLLWATLLGVWLLFPKTSFSRPLQQDYFFVPSPEIQLSEPEEKLFQQIQKPFQQTKQPWKKDPFFRQASDWLLRWIFQTNPTQLPDRQVKEALLFSGSPENNVSAIVLVSNSIEELGNLAKKKILQKIYSLRINTLGFRCLQKKSMYFLVILVNKRTFQPIVFPRWIRPQQTISLTFSNPPRNSQIVWEQKDIIRTWKMNPSQSTWNWMVYYKESITTQLLQSGYYGPEVIWQWHWKVLDPQSSTRLFDQWMKQKKKSFLFYQPPKTTKLSLRLFKEEKKEFKKRLQQWRKKRGLSLLSKEPELEQLAVAHAQDMKNNRYFGHQSPQKGSLRERFVQLKKKVLLISENIVQAKNAKQAFQFLLESPVHKRNIVSPLFDSVGIGVAQQKEDFLFVQIFAQYTPKKEKR